MMFHLSVITASCLKTKWRFPCLSLSVPKQEDPLKQTTTDRLILSTTSVTLFEVIVCIIVLQVDQVLHQSSAGMTHRVEVKGESAVSNNSVCVGLFVLLATCETQCGPFF